MHGLLVVATLVAGCGDNLKPRIELVEYDDARRSAECERLVRCGLFDDQPTCEGYARPASRASLEGALATGVVDYDGAAAFECVELLATISCDATTREARIEPDACLNVFTGTIADGDTCALDEECVSAECETPVCPKNSCCPGTCTPTRTLADLGEGCGDSVTCGADAFCATNGTCTALRAVGQPCDEEDDCEFGLGCIGATELQSGACRALAVVGGQCPYQRCSEIGAACSASFTCVPAGLTGSTCSRSEDCSRFSVCDTTASTCRNTPTLGMSCTTRCAGTSWCDGTKCAVPLGLNEPCGANDQCATTFCAEGPVSDYCAPTAVCF